MKISSQQGVVTEPDLAQVSITSYTNPTGVLLTGKLAGIFNRDTALNITVTTNEGFKFIGWIGYKCLKCYWAARPFNINARSITLNIDSDIFLTANFEKIPYNNPKNNK